MIPIRAAFATFLLFTVSLFAHAQTTKKFYYDKDWKGSPPGASASYYRIVNVDHAGKPVGKVKDYYISGELQWEGQLISMDPDDNKNDVPDGLCIWFYKNGRKSAESLFVNGKIHGISREWHENGQLKKEGEFLNNLPNGRVTEFYENGKLFRIANYEKGKFTGKWYTECDEFESCEKIFFEAFQKDGPDFGWVMTKNAAISRDSGMLLSADATRGSAGWVHLPLDLASNFSIATKAEFVSGVTDRGAMGLIYGFKDWDDYFYFQISPNGYYRIGGYVGGISIEEVKWTKSEKIHIGNGGRNLIKVSKLGNKVYFSINREIVESLDFYRFAGNNIGFYKANASNQVRFEMLDVRQDTRAPDVDVPRNPRSKWLWAGSGFFINPRGYLITNSHVVDGASEIEIQTRTGGHTGHYKGKVVATDKQNDLAIVKIDDLAFRPMGPLPYGFSTSPVDVGENVFVLGYPALQILGEEVKFTDGKISSKTGYKGDITTYQISVPIQPGSSGGPLFDYKGRIIGVINAKVLGLENVSYAVKSSYLIGLLDALPDKINLPNDRLIANKSLPEKIKVISDYVVLIRAK